MQKNVDWLDLYRKNPEAGWDLFLEKYNRLILAVIRKLVQDHDQVMELYSNTLERLKENECKKLRLYFSKPRKYNFQTWIVVVVRNCCLDWFRKEKGRKQLLKCIEALNPEDRWIFCYIYYHQHSYEVTYELLKTKHGFDISFDEMCSRLDKINHTLQNRTRWNLQNNWREILPPLSLESIETKPGKRIDPVIWPKSDLSPEEQIIKRDSEEILKQIFDHLSPEEQLIINLHFYRGLTFKEIARVLGLKNIWQVHRRLHKALKLLKKILAEKNIDLSDLENL